VALLESFWKNILSINVVWTILYIKWFKIREIRILLYEDCDREHLESGFRKDHFCRVFIVSDHMLENHLSYLLEEARNRQKTLARQKLYHCNINEISQKKSLIVF